MIDDFEGCYRFMQSRDPRYDGLLRGRPSRSTGVYCRPSCPARLPYRRNVRLLRKRRGRAARGLPRLQALRPRRRAGIARVEPARGRRRAGRAADRGRRRRPRRRGRARARGSHFTERQLNRILVAELGAGPVALARAQRAQTARTLIETTELPFAEVAVAAGFGSVRQFNDTVRAVYGRTPTELRRGAPGAPSAGGRARSSCGCRAASRSTASRSWRSSAARAIAGVEEVEGATYRRTLCARARAASSRSRPAAGGVARELRLADLRDLTAAVARCRRLLDLDADPRRDRRRSSAQDPLLGAARARAPRAARARLRGRRSSSPCGRSSASRSRWPAARTVLGPARRGARRAAAEPDGGLTHRFPAPPHWRSSTRRSSRSRARAEGARARSRGSSPRASSELDAGRRPRRDARALIAIPGIGPWTASYVAMRALGDPDVFLPGDVGIRHALARLGVEADPSAGARGAPTP